MRGKVLIFVMWLLIVHVSQALTQTTNQDQGFLSRYYDQKTAPRAGGSIIIDILNIVVALGVITLVAYLAIKFLRKVTGAPVEDYGVIEILASKSLSPSVSIHIIRIGKDYFAVSVGDKELNVIEKIEDKELINILNVEKSKESSEIKRDFFDTIISIFRKEKETEDIEKATSEKKFDFLKSQKSKIKKWSQ